MKLANTANTPWGPWWDATERPSFNLYWRGDFGHGELDYPLFPGYSIRNFQNLRLRAGKNDSGGDSPFITDELVRRLWIDMDQVGARGLTCSVYVNGVWKNIGNLTERIREPLLQAHYRSSADWDVRYVYEWVDGDGGAWSSMMSALNQNLATLANYQALKSKLDLDNFADYYLLNIYSAMWDWPENNFAFARERSTGPDSVFRYLVWDAEGGFNIKSYYAKPASFNTLVSDLTNKSVDVANIWKRLVLSSEWKLKMADHINRRMFNGGILDDRDPDGAGPLKSHFATRKDQLVSEASAIVQYYAGQALPTAAIDAWLNPTTGRRSFLLGTAANQNYFRNAGLWPLTEPPVFSQHGGPVPAGYNLTMTSTVATAGQTATIYYTLDGTDPRLEGGTLAAGAQTYAGPVTLNQLVTVKARAKNNTTAEWSALTEADFLVAAVPATPSSLVVSEIMYHPPDATAAEAGAGFTNADDFEFLRLSNISASPVNLAGVALTDSVTFDFTSGSVPALNPGGSVLVVQNQAAFQFRYGHAYDALITGVFVGNLNNGGERIVLTGPDGPDAGALPDVFRDFAYSDLPPWPTAADGEGASMVLRNPVSNPDHSLPENWIASAIPGGLPGGSPRTLTYAEWRALMWGPASAADDAISGLTADPDFDGFVNFVEYELGLQPRRSDSSAAVPRATLENIGGDRYLVLEYRTSAAATNVAASVEVSAGLGAWQSGPAAVVAMPPAVSNDDGTVTWKFRDATPFSTSMRRFIRLRLSTP
jgi:hypothetical protein